jgi:RNA polymerase sigma factor (sigma-70 family)
MSLRLPAEAERELLVAAQARREGARARLVEASLPLIASVARSYRGVRGVGRNELMQEGVVGLLKATDRYDADLGTPFWAYASWWVRQAMQQVVSELARPVNMSDRALRQLARIRDARRQHLTEESSEPSPAELSSITGLPRDRVESLIAVERTPLPLDGPIGDGGERQTFCDLLPDPRADDEYERADRRLDAERVRAVPCKLCRREKTVLSAHYGIGRPAATLREIGAELGLSAERVRQVEEEALDKLRRALTGAAPAD